MPVPANSWARLPPRRVLAVVVEGRRRILDLECGHRWETGRAYVVGQRIRCSRCVATASSHAWRVPTP